MTQSQESASSKESARNEWVQVARVFAFTLNFLLLGHFCVVEVFLGFTLYGPRSSAQVEFLLWSLAQMAQALINMAGLALPWNSRFFPKLRGGVVGVNAIAVIAYVYNRTSVRTGLSPVYQLVEASIFFCILGATVAPFLLARASSKPGALECPACGYDLRGSKDAGCPECGWRREEGTERQQTGNFKS